LTDGQIGFASAECAVIRGKNRPKKPAEIPFGAESAARM
jgi:hypothetical protein